MGRAPFSVKNGLKRGPWTPEEDHKLLTYVHDHGPKNWQSLPTNAGLERCGKSCRLRWTNYLRPDIKRGRFSFEEEETIVQLHSILGNKWSAIAARLPGRTDNEIKNFWNTHIRKRLLRMGIDPVTHNRRLDLLELSSILSSPLSNTSQLLMNPQFLQLATTLFALKHQNQLYNPQMQNHIAPTFSHHNAHFETLTQEAPTSNLEQTQFMQANVEGFTSNYSMQDSFVYTDTYDQLGHSRFESVNNDSDNNPSFGCVEYSTPLLDYKPLNSPSTLISISNEDDKESCWFT